MNGLERRGGRDPAGLWACIVQRLLALNTAIWHNWLTGAPARDPRLPILRRKTERKLGAARDLGIPVVIVSRPATVAAEYVTGVSDAVRWVESQLPPGGTA
jgi:hypothetical protein